MKAKKELSYEDALNKAADYCARSERSRNEVLQKMFCWGVAAPDAARIADWLEEKKFIDEERYAKAFVNDKYRFDYWGKKKIRYALRRNGIPEHIADLALEEIDESEYVGNLRKLLETKCRTIGNGSDPYKMKNTLFRLALSRGFETRFVAPIISELVSGADDFDETAIEETV